MYMDRCVKLFLKEDYSNIHAPAFSTQRSVPMFSYNFNNVIFTRQGIVISYLYTIPWQMSLLKIRHVFDWFHWPQMELITEDFSLRKQKLFFVEMESEN